MSRIPAMFATVASSAAAAIANVATASEATVFIDPPSTLTGAEVKAELQRAKANGELFSSSEADGSSPAAQVGARLTRAEVKLRCRC